MNRRAFLKSAVIGTMAAGVAAKAGAAEKYFPSKVDQGLFENINKVKDPANKTQIGRAHV
jgi:superoxide reductase